MSRGRSDWSSRVLVRGMWATVAIVSMWVALVVLFAGIGTGSVAKRSSAADRTSPV